MRRDGYANTLSIHTVQELYQEYAEELAIKSLLDFNKEELEEGLSITTEIL